MAEFAPRMPERVRAPSYIEDPTLRSERETRAINETIAAEIAALNESGELAALEGDALLEKLGGIGSRVALDLVEKKYDNPQNAELLLAYHNRQHSEVVRARVRSLIDAVNRASPGLISKQEAVEAELAAAAHDIDHVFETNDKGGRKRRAGEGEEWSAQRLTAIKEAINAALVQQGKSPAFAIDAAADRAMIAVTIPGFDPEKGVTQKELTAATPLTARILALSDLADFGMEGNAKLLASGKAIAIEDNTDIVDAIRAGKVSEHNEKEYLSRLVGAMAFQVPFAQSRMNQFAADLEGIGDPAVKAAIVEQFPYFEEQKFKETMQELEAEIAQVKNYTFEQIVEYLGIPEFIRRGA